MTVRKIDHVAIAVKDLEKAVAADASGGRRQALERGDERKEGRPARVRERLLDALPFF